MKHTKPKTPRKLKDFTHDSLPASVALESRLSSLESKFERLDSKFDTVIATVLRTQAIAEEMRNESRISLASLRTYIERYARHRVGSK